MNLQDFYNDKNISRQVKRELITENIFAKLGINLAQKATSMIKKYSPEKLQSYFNKWVDSQNQEGTGWTQKIPDCPCQLKVADDKAENPNPKDFEGPDPIQDQSLHPGAKWELRGKNGDGQGQQCCYDATGKLMTHGFGAGTADKVSPAKSVKGHFQADVLPFFIAYALDGNKHGRNVAKYISVRPPNTGENCPPNKGAKKAAE
jgi:hypothetical protein